MKKKLCFSNYFNIDACNELSIAKGVTPLTPWDEFLNKKPKNYIYVAIIHALKDYINLLRVKLVRRVCLSFFNTRMIMRIRKFTHHIYGDIEPKDTIVRFQIWKGFAFNDRVRVFQWYFHRSCETLQMVQYIQVTG